jgi:transcriptional regulator with XRE-family HTH domain
MARRMAEESGGSDIDHIAGRRIRQARLNAGMTLETLASQAGISKALLSKIENSKVSSPLATFSKISKVLGVPLSDLLKEEEQIKYLVVRKGDKKPALGRNTPQGFVYEALGSRWPSKSWNPFLITYTPVEKVQASPGLSYEGEEFVYVLDGRLGFYVGEQRFELDPGDCIFVDGSLPHGGRALDGKTCVALFIAVPR